MAHQRTVHTPRASSTHRKEQLRGQGEPHTAPGLAAFGQQEAHLEEHPLLHRAGLAVPPRLLLPRPLIPALEMPGLVSTPPLVQLHSKLEQGAGRRQKTRSKAQGTRSRLVSQSHSARRHEKTIVLAQCGEQPMGGNRQRRGAAHTALSPHSLSYGTRDGDSTSSPAPNPDVIILQQHTPEL